MKRHQKQLLGLFALFAAPVALAFLFSSKVIDPTRFGLVNRGELIDPPVSVRESSWFATIFGAPLPPADWAVLTVLPEAACAEDCAELARNLESLPLIMGQDGTRVRAGALTTDGRCSDLPWGACAELAASDMAVLLDKIAAGSALPATGPVTVFLDWRGNLMLGFAHPVPRDDLKKDLKKLLKATRK